MTPEMYAIIELIIALTRDQQAQKMYAITELIIALT